MLSAVFHEHAGQKCPFPSDEAPTERGEPTSPQSAPTESARPANISRLRELIRLMAAAIFSVGSTSCPAYEHVILLHGLCRTSRSMTGMASTLRQAGYRVWNIDYPSRTASIEQLGEHAIGEALTACRRDGATRVHFVTHSLGGILVRSYLARHVVPELGRVVMLAPPNQGSEVVDRLGAWKLFALINGPAGRELGTAPSSTPSLLGPAAFEVGVIAGNRSVNWINSCLIPGADDGKVSVERTRLAGMRDHIVIKAAHPFIMNQREAKRQTLHFLQHGAFARGPVTGM